MAPFKFILFVLVLNFQFTAHASLTCKALFKSSIAKNQYVMRAYQSRNIFLKSFGPEGESVRREVMTRNEYPEDYIGFITTPLQLDEAHRANSLAAGIHETHRNYGDRLSDEEKKLVMESDWNNFGVSLKSERLGYTAVGRGNRTFGFLRVYDGTFGPTPAEVLLQKKSVKTEYFSNLREKKMKIFELGKYFLDSNLEGIDRLAIRSEMFKWLLDTYLSGDQKYLEQRIFIIDVSSITHAKAYQKMFGAQIISADSFSPRLTDVDFVMTVSAEVLKEHLLKLIN